MRLFRDFVSKVLQRTPHHPLSLPSHLWPAWMVIALLFSQLAWNFGTARATRSISWHALWHHPAWRTYTLELMLVSTLGGIIAWFR